MDIGGYLMNVKKKEQKIININVNILMEIGNVSVVDLMNHVVKEKNQEIWHQWLLVEYLEIELLW
jgi:hypothetical protein